MSNRELGHLQRLTLFELAGNSPLSVSDIAWNIPIMGVRHSSVRGSFQYIA